MGKSIILEQEEVISIVEVLKGTTISEDILNKFQNMMYREQTYHNARKGLIAKVAFVFDKNYYSSPLDYEFKVKKITNVVDYTKDSIECLIGNYYVSRKKEHVFASIWEVKLYGYDYHIKILQKKIDSLKSDKGKQPYLDMVNKLNKKIDYINAHPEKMI